MPEAKKPSRRTIALVVDSLAGAGSYQEDIWRSTSEACREAGAGLLIVPGGALGGGSFNARYEEMKNVIYGLIRRECVDGVILAIGNIVHNASRAEYTAFARGFDGLPVVNVGFALEGVPGVVLSNERAMERLVEHLVADHRCKNVAFIRGPEQNADAIQRFQAYRTVLQKHGLPFRPELTYVGDFSEQSGAGAIHALLGERRLAIDGVAAAGDYMAIGAVKTLLSLGKRVPQDVAVTGYDDIYEAGVLSPGVTTLHRPLPAQMHQAVAVLLSMMEGKRSAEREYPVDITITRRRSCGCAAATFGTEVAVPAWSGVDRDHWLRETSRALAAEFPTPVAAGEVLSLFSSLFNDVEGGREDAFLPEWEKFFNAHFKRAEELPGVMSVMNAFRRAVTTLAGPGVPGTDRLLNAAHNSLMEIVFRLEALRRTQVEWLASELTRAGLLLGGTFDIPLLSRTLQGVLPPLGVRHCLLGLYEDPARPLEAVRIAARVRDGKEMASGDAAPVPAWRALAGERDFLDAGGRAAVCPLIYQDEQIGFLFMEVPTEYGFMYEMVVSQLCIAVHGARLVEKNVRARDVIEEHSRRIQQLSRPMMESVREISDIATAKMESVHVLVDRTNRSRDKIGETNKNIETISAHTSKLLDIIAVIDEIAERVNLLALNASIEATHVGQEGRGFSVIAKEIKKLAENTGAHSNEIAATLKEIIDSAERSSRNGRESLEAFREQSQGVTDILDSFRAISEKMRRLGESSETILKLIKEE